MDPLLRTRFAPFGHRNQFEPIAIGNLNRPETLAAQFVVVLKKEQIGKEITLIVEHARFQGGEAAKEILEYLAHRSAGNGNRFLAVGEPH